MMCLDIIVEFLKKKFKLYVSFLKSGLLKYFYYFYLFFEWVYVNLREKNENILYVSFNVVLVKFIF